MIRLLLMAVGAWAAWRYRQQIKEKAGEVLHGVRDASSAGRRQQQARP
jgi:hypothetical protein